MTVKEMIAQLQTFDQNATVNIVTFMDCATIEDGCIVTTDFSFDSEKNVVIINNAGK
jgi:hypothetical protein